MNHLRPKRRPTCHYKFARHRGAQFTPFRYRLNLADGAEPAEFGASGMTTVLLYVVHVNN